MHAGRRQYVVGQCRALGRPDDDDDDDDADAAAAAAVAVGGSVATTH